MNDNDIIEIIDEIDEKISPQDNEDIQILDIEKKVLEANYEPIEPEKEKISVVDDVEPSKNKSGLLLVIILFIFLAAFIILLPKITETFGNLF